MRILLDACIWGGARHTLEKAGHDVIWAGDWSTDPGDGAILSQAVQESRIVVTQDKDFGELIVVQGQLHCGLIRLVGFPARKQGPVLVVTLDRYAEELQAGSLVTVDPGRVRIRPCAE